MRFSGNLKPFKNNHLRFGAIPGVQVIWSTVSGSLATVFQGQAVTATLVAASSDKASVSYSISAGVLPAGVTLNAKTGVITGTPTSTGMAAFTVRATAGKYYSDRSFAITATPLSVAWTTPSGSLGTFAAGVPGYVALAAAGNDGAPVTYALLAGSLPAGVSLSSTGVIAGKASNTAGTYSFTIRATRTGSSSVYLDRPFTLTVAADVVTWTTGTGSLGAVTGGNAFTSTVAATTTIPNAAVTYAVIYGTLPQGLSLNTSTGAITGTAGNVNGTSLFRIRASDGYGYADQQFTITVNADTVTWSTASGLLGALNGGDTFSTQLQAATNIAGRTVRYVLQSGTLPQGLSLNGTTGVISGTAANVNAQSTFLIRATDGIGFTDQVFQINVTADVVVWQTPVQVTFNQSGGPYSTPLVAVDSKGLPVTYSVVSGAVPDGYTYDPVAGTISGQSTTVTTTTLTVRATSAVTYADRTFTVSVNGPPVWQTITGSIGSVLPSQHFQFTVSATDPDGLATYAFANGTSLGETVTVAKSATGNTGVISGYMTTPVDLLPPTWATANLLANVNEGFATNLQLQATPTQGRTIANYATVAGMLPVGMSLQANGTLVGSATSIFDEAYMPLTPTPLFATPANLGTNNEGDTFSVAFSAVPQLGNAIVSYAYLTGQMPWGLTLTGSVLSGTIGQIEPSDLTIYAGVPPVWQTANSGVILTLNETNLIVPNSVILQATPGSANASISAYAVVGGSLPWGTTLNTTTGTLSGAPLFVESDDTFINATGPIFLTKQALGTYNEGDALSQLFEATPITGNAVSTYSLESGQIPWGLSLNPSTGLLTGNVGQIEPVFDTVYVPFPPVWNTDDVYFGVYDEVEYFFDNQTVSASAQNGKTIQSYHVSYGSMPWGISLNTANGALTGSILFDEQIDSYLDDMPPVWVTSNAASLGTWNEGASFSANVLAVANTLSNAAVVNYGFVSGALPWGVALNPLTGFITGTVNNIEPLIDPVYYTSQPVWQTTANTVLFAGDELDSVTASIRATTGGTGLSYAISNGALPWGVTMNTTTGAISGQVAFTEANAAYLDDRVPTWITANAVSLGAWNEGDSFSQSFAAMANSTSNAAVVNYGLVAGSIPWGVSLTTSSGVLAGTVANIEPVSDATVLGTAPNWQTASGSLGTFANTAVISTAVSASLTGSAITYGLVSGALPWGTILSANSGAITGTLNATDDANKTFSFKIRAYAVPGGYADQSFTITVQ